MPKDKNDPEQAKYADRSAMSWQEAHESMKTALVVIIR
jgi:hypothetical protein